MSAPTQISELLDRHRSGFTLAQPFYTDPAVFEEDLERIFYRTWLFAGHECQIPQPGDYFTFDVGRAALIIVRGDDGKVRAFSNSCRHRGSRICTEHSGRVGKFACPYHNWVYERNGRLAAAKWMGDNFDRNNHSLLSAHVEVLQGLIFVCLAATPPSFERARQDIELRIRPHGMDRVRICHVEEHVIHANWKVIVENNRECYHCPSGHPEYCKVNYDLGMPGDGRPNDAYERHLAEKSAIWRAQGLEPSAINFPDGEWYRCARMPLRPGCLTESMDGQQVAPLLGDLKSPDAGGVRLIALPHAWFHINSDYANSTQLIPVGPELTRSRIAWFVRENAREGVDFQTHRVVDYWKITTEQDWKLSEINHQGIRSLQYKPGPLSPLTESGVGTFHEWYLRQLRGEPVEVTCRAAAAG
ncbi:MAG TPA: aromatic ring-hydroxylating dioxygenase subunit alpha [Planctomycetota bacterium]|nr:aromatic ring-hydroxylating dioxygenase subunit alpha [Planctomycetota bacterium]